MHGGTHVVGEARECKLFCPGSAANRAGTFDQLDRQASLREHYRGGESIGAGADDDGIWRTHNRAASS